MHKSNKNSFGGPEKIATVFCGVYSHILRLFNDAFHSTRCNDVSQEHIAVIFRVEEQAKQEMSRSRCHAEWIVRGKSGLMWASPSPKRTVRELSLGLPPASAYSSILKMGTNCTSETPSSFRSTRHSNPLSDRRQNFTFNKPYNYQVKLSLCLTKHHAMKTYWEAEVQLHAANSFIPGGKKPWYPLERRLSGPQSRCGRCGEEKYPRPGRPSLYQLSYRGSYSIISKQWFERMRKKVVVALAWRDSSTKNLSHDRWYLKRRDVPNMKWMCRPLDRDEDANYFPNLRLMFMKSVCW
jgi:hypothetical protein